MIKSILKPLAFFAALLPFAPATYAGLEKSTSDVIKPKVVVVAMFELGEFTGDTPGEFQLWVERVPLPETIKFPQGYRDLRYNEELGVLGVVTGIGTFKSAATIMGLGMDPRFDFSESYWLIAGISGADPEDMSLGSAAWAQWVIDGDLSHEIDMREVPEGWETGYIPLRKKSPYEQPVPENNEGVMYKLNTELVELAYNLTKDLKLYDDEGSQALRQKYVNFPNAQKAPSVLIGDQLAAMTYWHGKHLNKWANDWVKYWTRGEGNFVTSAMEDTGTLQSLTFLDNAGKADVDRVLVLRTASNFTMQHSKITAQQSLTGEDKGKYSAYIPSLENAYIVGKTVVDYLLEESEEEKSE